jgi:hypothetical protein
MVDWDEIHLSHFIAVAAFVLNIISMLVAISDLISFSNFSGKVVTYVININSSLLTASLLLVISPILSMIAILILLQRE